MQPTHAEVARTLAAGHLPASAHIACRQGPFPVRHVTDAQGRMLLLSPRDGALAAALRPIDGNDDTALVLDIADVPPVAGAPSLGRVWVAGWARAADRRGGPAGRPRLRRHRPGRRPARRRRQPGAAPDGRRRGPLRAQRRAVRRRPRRVRRGRPGPAAGDRVRPDRRPGRPPRRRDDRLRTPPARPGRPARRTSPRSSASTGTASWSASATGSPGSPSRAPVPDRHDLAHLLHPVLCHRCGHAA